MSIVGWHAPSFVVGVLERTVGENRPGRSRSTAGDSSGRAQALRCPVLWIPISHLRFNCLEYQSVDICIDRTRVEATLILDRHSTCLHFSFRIHSIQQTRPKIMDVPLDRDRE